MVFSQKTNNFVSRENSKRFVNKDLRFNKMFFTISGHELPELSVKKEENLSKKMERLFIL